MRITHALAAAALAAGLATGAPAAQAAPLTAPAVHAQQTYSPAAASKSSKATTRTTISGPATAVPVGDDIKITGKLTRKSGSSYKAYASAKLELVLLDAPGSETGEVIKVKKTDKKGKVTFVLETDPEIAGQSFDFLVAYEGGSKAKASESDVITVTVGE